MLGYAGGAQSDNQQHTLSPHPQALIIISVHSCSLGHQVRNIITETETVVAVAGCDTGDLLTSAVAECGAETWDRGHATVPSSRQPATASNEHSRRLKKGWTL